MKKITLIFVTVFLTMGIFSCTPDDNITDDLSIEQKCCDEDGEILPPPPPPTEGRNSKN